MNSNYALIPMKPEEFRLLRELIRDYCGIYFDDSVQFLLERRLQARLKFLALPNFTEYYRYIKYSAQKKSEFDEIVERVTTNETYFFREQYQLKALEEEILPELKRQILARPPSLRRLRIWSAGCSTGEEPYTVAIIASEALAGTGIAVEVFGNDISRKVLKIARSGRYGHSSFRTTPQRYLKRYFKELPDGKFEIARDIKTVVSFGQINLMEPEMMAMVGMVDVILCRNVMIYFDERAKKQLISTLHDRLRFGGYLLLGHSESLLNVTTNFEIVNLKNDLVYRKPDSELDKGKKETRSPGFGDFSSHGTRRRKDR